jgi:hypothetical protein
MFSLSVTASLGSEMHENVNNAASADGKIAFMIADLSGKLYACRAEALLYAGA